MTYTATIVHHSIARARVIEVEGTLAEAKAAAWEEFGDEQLDYQIAVYDEDGDIVASRRVGAKRWD